MNQQQRDHQTAVVMIEFEMETFTWYAGDRHASSGVCAAIELAYLLRCISEDEHIYYRKQVQDIRTAHLQRANEGKAA